MLPCTLFLSIPGSPGKQGAWIYLDKLGLLLQTHRTVPAFSNHLISKPGPITYLNHRAGKGRERLNYLSSGAPGLDQMPLM